MEALTLRERNKSDKQRRITQAARELFSRQGYDATTTRDIAHAAHVGLATLFLYASDKRDLLFLACNDDLEQLTRRAAAGLADDLPLMDALTGFFEPFFLLYSENRHFWRDVLRELTFFTVGQQSERFQRTRHDNIDIVERLLGHARVRREITTAKSDRAAAEVLFFVFAAEVRRWLSDDSKSAATGVAELRSLFEVVVDGLR